MAASKAQPPATTMARNFRREGTGPWKDSFGAATAMKLAVCAGRQEVDLARQVISVLPPSTSVRPCFSVYMEGRLCETNRDSKACSFAFQRLPHWRISLARPFSSACRLRASLTSRISRERSLRRSIRPSLSGDRRPDSSTSILYGFAILQVKGGHDNRLRRNELQQPVRQPIHRMLFPVHHEYAARYWQSGP